VEVAEMLWVLRNKYKLFLMATHPLFLERLDDSFILDDKDSDFKKGRIF
jgi:hypothetical protein